MLKVKKKKNCTRYITQTIVKKAIVTIINTRETRPQSKK